MESLNLRHRSSNGHKRMTSIKFWIQMGRLFQCEIASNQHQVQGAIYSCSPVLSFLAKPRCKGADKSHCA